LFLLQIAPRKAHFWMHDCCMALCCFPLNEYNNGHPYLWQWLLVVLVPMIVYSAKRLFLVQIFGKNSPFSHIMMIVTFCWLVCPLNEYNDGKSSRFPDTVFVLPALVSGPKEVNIGMIQSIGQLGNGIRGWH
jgi:hypothetical protein